MTFLDAGFLGILRVNDLSRFVACGVMITHIHILRKINETSEQISGFQRNCYF